MHRSVSFSSQLGLSVPEALATATSVSAEACGVGDRKGLLRKRSALTASMGNGDRQAHVTSWSDVRTVVLGPVPSCAERPEIHRRPNNGTTSTEPAGNADPLTPRRRPVAGWWVLSGCRSASNSARARPASFHLG